MPHGSAPLPGAKGQREPSLGCRCQHPVRGGSEDPNTLPGRGSRQRLHPAFVPTLPRVVLLSSRRAPPPGRLQHLLASTCPSVCPPSIHPSPRCPARSSCFTEQERSLGTFTHLLSPLSVWVWHVEQHHPSKSSKLHATQQLRGRTGKQEAPNGPSSGGHRPIGRDLGAVPRAHVPLPSDRPSFPISRA